MPTTPISGQAPASLGKWAILVIYLMTLHRLRAIRSYLKQKRTRITPDPDEDLAIRTVIGEAKGEGERGWQAVAGVIRNRANQARQSLKDVVLAPNQFEPWSSRKQELESYDPNSPTYQNVARAVLPVLRGEAEDPTGGATHFYGPGSQAALGRKPPSWDNGSGMDIGNHRFFKLGYSGVGKHGAANVQMPKVPDYSFLQNDIDEIIGKGGPSANFADEDIAAASIPSVTPPVTVPEAPDTIAAQVQAAADPNVKARVGVLTTSPEQNALFGNTSGFTLFPTPDGRSLWVNLDKAKKVLKLRDEKHVENYIRNNYDTALARITGTAASVPDTTQGPTVLTTKNGIEQSAKVAPTPAAQAKQFALDQESFPGSQSQVVDAQDVVAQRVPGKAEYVVNDLETDPRSQGNVGDPSQLLGTDPTVPPHAQNRAVVKKLLRKKQAEQGGTVNAIPNLEDPAVKAALAEQAADPNAALVTTAGEVQKPRVLGKAGNDDLAGIAATYQTSENESEEDAFRNAYLKAGSQYGVTPQMVEQKIAKIKASGKPLFSTGYHPGSQVGVSFDDLKDVGAPDIETQQRMEQAQSRPGLVTPKDLHVGENWQTEQTDWLNKNAGRAILGPAAPLFDSLPQGVQDTLNNIGASAAGGFIDWGGSNAARIGGAARYLSALPVIGEGADDVYQTMKGVAESSTKFADKSGDGGITSQIFRAAGKSGDLFLMSALPGGFVVSMPLLTNLETAGRGGTAKQIATQTVKAGAEGLLYKYAPFVGAFGAAMSSAKGVSQRAIDELLTVATGVGGTKAIENLAGSSDAQADQAAMMYAIYHMGGLGVSLAGMTFRGRNAKGDTYGAEVQPDGTIKLLRGAPKKPDAEVYVDVEKGADGVYRAKPKGYLNAPKERGNPVENPAPSEQPVPLQGEIQGAKRIATPVPDAVQKAPLDTRAHKIADVLADGQPKALLDISRSIRSNPAKTTETIELLYAAGKVEILPDNTVRLIEPLEKGSTSLYERFNEQGKVQEPLVDADTNVSQTIQGQVSANDKAQTSAASKTADNTQKPAAPDPTEQRRLDWQNKVQTRIDEIGADSPRVKNLIGGRELSMMTSGQLKDVHKALENVQPEGLLENKETQQTSAPEPIVEPEKGLQSNRPTATRPTKTLHKTLSQYVRATGGIKSTKWDTGEHRRLSNKETGTTGLINKNGKTAEEMATSAWESGYLRDLFPTFADIDGNVFMDAVEQDFTGARTHLPVQAYEDLDRDIEKHYKDAHEKELAQLANVVKDNPDVLAKIVETGDANDEQFTALERAFEKHGLDPKHVGTFVSDYIADHAPVSEGTVREAEPAPERSVDAVEARSEPAAVTPQESAPAKKVSVPKRSQIDKPITGPTGAKIIGYDWKSKLEEYVDERGEDRVRRVSDWDEADKSEGTGRSIVHHYYVEHPDGSITLEGINSAQNILGIAESRLQTIAKNEQAAQQYREESEERSRTSTIKRLATDDSATAAGVLRRNLRGLSDTEQDGILDRSTLFVKDGAFIRAYPESANITPDILTERGWKPVPKSDDPYFKATAQLAKNAESPQPETRKLEDLTSSERSQLRRSLAPKKYQGREQLQGLVAKHYNLPPSEIAKLAPLGEVGKFGQTSHILKAALSSPDNFELFNAFSKIFTPEIKYGPDDFEFADRGADATAILDTIAENEGFDRSSQMDAGAWQKFLDRYAPDLSDDAITTILSALEHQEKWHRNILNFVADPALDEPNRMIFERGEKFGWEQFANPKWGTVQPEHFDPNNAAFDLKGDNLIKKLVLKIGRKYGIQESRGEGGLSDTTIKQAYIRAVQRTAQEQLAKRTGAGSSQTQSRQDTSPGEAEKESGRKEELDDIPFSRIPHVKPLDSGDIVNGYGQVDANAAIGQGNESGRDNVSPAIRNDSRNEGKIRETSEAQQTSGTSLEERKSSRANLALKKWFGDSKVVDANGNPLQVYHGTNADFVDFRKDKLGTATKARSSKQGFFFTNNADIAHFFADDRTNPFGSRSFNDEPTGTPNIMPVYLRIERPLYTDIKGLHDLAAKGEIDRTKYDGVIATDEQTGQQELLVFEPNQIKSAIGNRGTFDPSDPSILHSTTTYSNPLTKTGWFEPVKGEGDVQFQAAWHGSPHVFDKFSTEKIGTGEGAQAYGHGIYFTDSEGIADFYRRKLSRSMTVPGAPSGGSHYIVDGVEFPEGRNGHVALDLADMIDQYLGARQRKGTPDAYGSTTESFLRERIDDKFDNWRKELHGEVPTGSANEDVADLESFWSQVYDIPSSKIKERPQGAKYKVDLKPEPDEYLLWDKPLSEQSEKVRRLLSRLPIAPTHDMAPKIRGAVSRNATGKEFYDLIGRHLQPDSGFSNEPQIAASNYLNSLGIHGIKYLDGTSRDKGEGSYNYVIFDDNDVEIKEVHFNAVDDRRANKLFAAASKMSPMELVTKAEFGIEKGILKAKNVPALYILHAATENIDPKYKGINFSGAYYDKNVTPALLSILDAAGKEAPLLVRRKFARVAKLAKMAVDKEHGDLVVSLDSPQLPTMSRTTLQEELGHRFNRRSGVREQFEGANPQGTLGPGYEGSKTITIADEKFAKSLRDDAEAELNLSRPETRANRKLLFKLLKDANVDLEAAANELETISRRGQGLARYARNASRRNNGTVDAGNPRGDGETAEGLQPARRQGTRDRRGFAERAANPVGGRLNEFDRKAPQVTPAEHAYIVKHAKGDTKLQTAVESEIQFSRRDPDKMTVGDYAIDILNMPKAIKASFDLSAAGRQGWITSLAHPVFAAKAFGKQLQMLPPVSGAKAHDKFARDLDLHPYIELAEESGLFLATLAGESINEREEQFLSRMLGENRFFKNNKFEAARKLATFGVRASERAYTTYLDTLRINVFTKLSRELAKKNARAGRENDPEQFKGLARFINYSTGRGDLGRFDGIAKELNAGLFSARYWASRLQVMNPKFYATLPKGARGMVLKDLFASMGAVAIIAALLKLAGGKIEYDDPNDPNTLKVGFGNYTYDISAGLLKHLRYLGRMVMATQEKQPADKMEYLTTRYIRSSLAPVPGAAVNSIEGKDYIGQPTDWKQEGIGLFRPIMADNFVDAAKADGAAGLAKMAPEFFGVSVTRMSSQKEIATKRDEEIANGRSLTGSAKAESDRKVKVWNALIARNAKYQKP
jgi:hypothetical protein